MNDDFNQYRKEKGYSQKTIKSQDSYLRKFNAWLDGKGINLKSINYQTILSFVSDERKKGTASANLRNRLQAIRIYLDYNRDIGIIESNPAVNIKLQDKGYKTLPPAIEEETLHSIYKTFTTQIPSNEQRKLQQERDSVALGLMIFQGLDSGDLERLTIKDINLTEGTIYIAASRKNAARSLKLESLQILSIHLYITTQSINDKLFTKSKVNDMVSAIVAKLKKQYPEILNPRHIRSSVIQNWLKRYHIRKVQYMAGHRRVSSTERYRREDINDLANQISRYHPIK